MQREAEAVLGQQGQRLFMQYARAGTGIFGKRCFRDAHLPSGQ